MSRFKSMAMPMMGIGPMNVLMGHPFMHMVMIVWLHIVFIFVQMTVMFILIMCVLVAM